MLAQIVWAQYTLEEQNLQQEYLDPANQLESEEPPKDQDKRTIFPSTISSYGWAKHVGINQSGSKYVLGYSPVDLKYVPVVRPISARPTYQLRPTRPKWRPVVLKPLTPVQKPQQGGWKPVYGPPMNVSPQKPTQEVGGSDVFLQLPVKPPVPFRPVVPAQSVPVTPLVPVKPVAPLVPVSPVRPAFPAITPLQPVIPSAPLPPSLPPSSPLLFHVNRPNLPVLPLGAVFPSPVLQPTALKPVAPPGILFPQALPVPAFSSVEFHGNHNILRQPPFSGAPTSILPAAPVPAFAPAPAPVFQPAPTPIAPIFPSAPFTPHLQTGYQGELPRQTPNVGLEQHDVQIPQTHQHLYQQDFQPSFHLQQDYEQQYQQQQQEQSNFQGIHPGQTDVQIPLHLPTHPHFRPVDLPSFQQGDFQTPFQSSANIVRPSIGLEPPYQKRRREDSKDDGEEGDRDYEEN